MAVAVPWQPESWSMTRTIEGYEATEIYLVRDLSGDGPQQLYDALNASGLPTLGQAHSYAPSTFTSALSVDMFEPGSGKVTVNWGRPPFSGSGEPGEAAPLVMRVGSRTQSTTRAVDVSGNFIAAYADSESGDSEPDEQFTTAEVQVQNVLFQLSRREQGSPGDKARTYVGTVNALPVFGDPARQWLCTAIEGTSADGGITYDVTYEFERSPYLEGWDFVAVFTDRDTGEISSRSRLTMYQIYPATVFQNIGI